ncbi:MAG: TIGR03905 family TSCPD domain-containing protein [Succinivibrio sp.]
MFVYQTSGTCCRTISVQLDGKTIKEVDFEGGCHGNLKAIAKLVKGKSIDEIIPVLRGNTCKSKPTSCADQLTYALEQAYRNSTDTKDRN